MDHEAFGPGSRARVRQPKLPTMVWTVTHLEPGHFFIWKTQASGVTTVADHRVDPAPDGKSVIVTLSIEESGPLSPLVRLFYSGLTRRYVEMEAAGLKELCERESLARVA
jgi:hypothetical protein